VTLEDTAAKQLGDLDLDDYSLRIIDARVKLIVREAIRLEREACVEVFLSLAYDPEYQKLDALSGDYMIDAEKVAAEIRART
jgi:sugar/nucleoside kinase (ribokinase family)